MRILSCNNVALPYFTLGNLPSPRNIKILKIGDGYVIAAREFFEEVRNSKVINSRNFHNNVQKKDKQQT